MSDRRRAASAKPAQSEPSAIPAGYYGPRLAGQQPDLCHRHRRTIIKGHSCLMGRDETDDGVGLPDFAQVNPDARCFNDLR